jgi:hypothetical protein
MIDAGLLRKRVRTEIDAARRTSAERRQVAAAATRAYETFLETIAVPAFRQMANVLRAEGVPFEAQTPSGSVRLVSDRSRDDLIELALDAAADPPQPTLVTTRTRGGRLLRTERALKERAAIDKITEDEVIEALIEELRPWLS